MTTLHILDNKLWFPPVSAANADGLLAAGGDLRPERLILAYRKGIFPWYEGDVPLWWSPDPRFVLFPNELYISKSMKQVLRRQVFQFSRNRCFVEVMAHCKTTPRPGQDGTWISPAMQEAYGQLHDLGYAISFEAWQQGRLVGGLYGVLLGKVFFGESMFCHVSNASKAAFIYAVQWLQQQGIVLIDCQVYTAHLESLGARFIDREEFMELLLEHVDC